MKQTKIIEFLSQLQLVNICQFNINEALLKNKQICSPAFMVHI